jgi:hypothetical protein
MLVRASLYLEADQKLYPIITQLRAKEGEAVSFWEKRMNQDRRHRRDCSLFPIDAHFPKLDAGGVPTPALCFQLPSAILMPFPAAKTE